MIDYYNDILIIEANWLTDPDLGGIMSKVNYGNLTQRGFMKVVRRGCRNNSALIEYASIPERFKLDIVAKLGYDPVVRFKKSGFKNRIVRDAEALAFYSSYRLADGRALPTEVIEEYVVNASVLNTMRQTIADKKAMSRALGNRTKGMWEKLVDIIESFRPELGHTLPGNERRLKDKYTQYVKEGYTALIHKGYCNDNSRKVSVDMERLILSLYGMPEKPYASTVAEMYLQFVGGAIEVVDCETGELFNREDFYDASGAPIVISDSTCWNYINDPKNRAFVDKVRNGSLEFTAIHRPHHHRHKPIYGLSKVSLDDRDLPRKMKDGTRVKAYYAYDVASGCVVGASFSYRKDTHLFIDCIRDMFGFLQRHNTGIPMEMEVEHHIVNQFKDDLMQAGVLFPFVRWCNPGNSQEKHAEHFNREKKYGYEKRYQQGIGRFYAKLEANKPKTEKVASETNDQWKEKYYSYEELVADDRDVIERYNNDLHPNQKKYKGKTRLQVLIENLNPNLARIDMPLLARYIGDKTTTTIRRNQYVTVQYGKYQLSSPGVLSRLQPNNYEVEAYYMRNEDGSIDCVHIYQDGKLVDTCKRIETYNTAKAEQTEADAEAYTEQSKYVSQFDKMVKDGKADKVKKVQVIPVVVTNAEAPVVPLPPPEEPDEWTTADDDYDADFYANYGKDSL